MEVGRVLVIFLSLKQNPTVKQLSKRKNFGGFGAWSSSVLMLVRQCTVVGAYGGGAAHLMATGR